MARSSHIIEKTCPAKVNLVLDVGPPDRAGFHPIASWMVSVDLTDTLRVRRSSREQSQFHVSFSAHCPRPCTVDWSVTSDLTYKAHQAIEKRLSRILPVEVELEKTIPTEAGLGGGSNNAAGMLVALRELFDLPLTDAQLIRLGFDLGSDVAFGICAALGRTAAIVSGTGQIVDPLPSPKLDLVLVFPPLACATGRVYQQFDQGQQKHPLPDVAAVRRIASQQPVQVQQLFNKLQEPAMTLVPELGRIRKQVEQSLTCPVMLSGSGSTLFAVADSSNQAEQWSQTIQDQMRLPARAVRTIFSRPQGGMTHQLESA